MTKATTKEMVMVDRIMGRDCFPWIRISDRFIPKPKSTTAYCRIFFEVKVTPPLHQSFFLRNSASTMPMRIANTGPPTTGSQFPSSHAGTAMPRHNKIPGPYFFTIAIIIKAFLKSLFAGIKEYYNRYFLLVKIIIIYLLINIYYNY